MISKLNVMQRLLLLVVIPVIGGVVTAGFLFRALDKVRIGGDLSNSMTRQAELVADILPPPLFVIELYAVAEHITIEQDAAKRLALISEVDRLSGEFETRSKYWADKDLDPELREAIFTKAAAPARELIAVVREKLVPAARSGDTAAAPKVFSDQVQPLFDKHIAEIRKASTLATKLGEEINAGAIATTDAARTNALIAAGVVGMAIIPLAYFMICSVLRPIRTISNAMHEVANGTGDLRTHMHVSNDRSEIGQLAENFNTFLDCVNSMVIKIEKMSADIGASADEISSSAAEGQRATQHQNENLRRMLQGVDEMSTSAGQIAAISTKASEAAQRTGQVAGEGDKAVSATIDGMGRIDSTVSEGAASVSKLGERSREIGQIIAVINDIADQTNLLALNAAIEAARAGEHGRGFAVVADEVRKLAERTTAATKQVSDSIGEIQTMTAGSVQSITAGSEEVKRGITAAQSTTESLRRIIEQAGNTGRLITDITTSAAEQARLGEGIRDGVRQVSSAAEELERTSTLTAQSTAEMAQSSRQLKELVAHFQVERRTKKSVRVPLVLPISANLGTIVEMNAVGASVVASNQSKFSIGQSVEIEFAALGRQFRLSGTVRWIKSMAAGDRFGMQFNAAQPELAAVND